MKTVENTLATLMVAAIVAVVLAGCKKTDEPENNGEGLNVGCMLPDNVEAVDLGLPSGLKWANMNVGATTPEGYGAYFAWGETEPKTSYDIRTYKWCNGSDITMTKYCTSSSYGTVDNKTTLDSIDDAAYVNWGGDWRMPTEAEFQELKANCTWTWVDNYNDLGIAGYIASSKHNSNSIFLPASGFRQETSLLGVNSYSNYWSSSLMVNYSAGARALHFKPGNVGMNYYNRRYGQPVRPVCK